MKKSLGQKGEDLACEYLKNKGYKIIDRNFRCKLGELDIIAKKKKNLIFVEVKTKAYNFLDLRRENFFPPELNLTSAKQHKLINLSRYYSAYNNHFPRTPWQIDIIAIEFFPDGQRRIRHLENAVIDKSY